MPYCSARVCPIARALALALFVVAFVAVTTARAQAPLLTLTSPNPELGGEFGVSVSGVPDVNGDSRADVLVGGHGERGLSGRAYLFSGTTGALLRTLQTPNPERFGFFGTAVAGVADVNGDGRGDLLVGARNENEDDGASNAGRAYLFSGATGTLLRTLNSPTPSESGHFGASVAGVADVDGDGRGDLLVGASGESFGGPDYAGRAHLFSGATGTLLRTLESPNSNVGGEFASSLAGVADVNADGISDLFVGARNETLELDKDILEGAGRAYLFDGSTGTLLRTLTSPDPEAQGDFGGDVAGVADVNGDGIGDLLVGARNEDLELDDVLAQAGNAYLFDGSTGALLRAFQSPNPESFGRFGTSVSGLADADGDGLDDLIIGAPFEDNGPLNSGRAYLYSSATGTLLRTLTSPNPESDGHFGDAVEGVGALLVGAPLEDGGAPDAGRAYLFSGRSGVEVEPVNPPIVIPPAGGSFLFTLTISNATDETQTFEIWTRVTKPNGMQTGALLGPISLTLAPGASKTTTLEQSVPGRLAAGSYTYTAYVGIYPDDVIDSDGFVFAKLGSPEPTPD